MMRRSIPKSAPVSALVSLAGTLLGLPDREKMTEDLAFVWTAKRTSLARAAAA